MMVIASIVSDDHKDEQTEKRTLINSERMSRLTESEQAQTISLGFIGLMSIDVMPHLLRISTSSVQFDFKQ